MGLGISLALLVAVASFCRVPRLVMMVSVREQLVLLGHLQLARVGRLAGRLALHCVGLDVEGDEEPEEEEGAESLAHDEDGRKGALLQVEWLERVDQGDEELENLEAGQVLLPPEVLLDRGAEGAQAVVAVHDDVDHQVQVGDEAADWEECELDADPEADRNNSVVEDVEEADVGELLAEDEEDGVEEVEEARDEHQPDDRNGLLDHRLDRLLAAPAVEAEVEEGRGVVE